MDTVICPKCNQESRSNALYCDACGASLKNVAREPGISSSPSTQSTDYTAGLGKYDLPFGLLRVIPLWLGLNVAAYMCAAVITPLMGSAGMAMGILVPVGFGVFNVILVILWLYRLPST